MQIRKKTMKYVLIALAAIILIAGVILLLMWLEKKSETPPDHAGESGPVGDETDPVETVFYDGKEYAYNKKLSTLLILGIDDYDLVETNSYRNTSQADLILVAVFDPLNEKCTMIQLNRDTMADIQFFDSFGTSLDLRNEQLALAHTYGNGLAPSCENTVRAVSRFLYGIEIDNYFSLTMNAIPVLNDLVGGVRVTIEDDFTGVDDTLKMGQTVTLRGSQAETYVRSRSSMPGDSSNIARMRRQRTYMASLAESLRSSVKRDVAFVFSAFNALSDYMVTDCTVNKLSDYANRFSSYTVSDIVSPEGEAVVGEQFMEFYVDEDSLQELIIKTFYVPIS